MLPEEGWENFAKVAGNKIDTNKFVDALGEHPTVSHKSFGVIVWSKASELLEHQRLHARLPDHHLLFSTTSQPGIQLPEEMLLDQLGIRTSLSIRRVLFLDDWISTTAA